MKEENKILIQYAEPKMEVVSFEKLPICTMSVEGDKLDGWESGDGGSGSIDGWL